MFYLAIRHLLARKKQTLFTLLGVFFASTSFVVITAFFLGFQEFLIDQLLNNDAHIRISSKEEFIQKDSFNPVFFPNEIPMWVSAPSGRRDNNKILNPQGWYHRLKQDPRVQAFSPQLTAQVLMTRAQAQVTARMIGSNAEQQQQVTNIREYMIQGKFLDISVGGNRVIVGDELLSKLGAHVSETILISNGKSAPVPFKVVGSFHVGIRSLDQGVAFAALSDVQRINQTPTQVNEIAVRIQNVQDAYRIAKDWEAVSTERVQSWDEINTNVLNVFAIQNGTRIMMTAVILLVAGFGIYNILNMVVTQKRKDIAILRSMGFEQKDIVSLFLSQGFIVGSIGGVLGLIIGYWISRGLEMIPFGGGPLGTGAGHMTVSFAADIYIKGLLFSLISALIASYLPARSAGKLTPIEIIRAGTE
jgi:lipoprotein-releasing system permease protein